jgi:hypothetical protein
MLGWSRIRFASSSTVSGNSSITYGVLRKLVWAAFSDPSSVADDDGVKDGRAGRDWGERS